MTTPGFGFGLQPPSRPRVFVSYHHHNDRSYYDQFVHLFEDTYDTVQDTSVDREIDSENSEYVLRNIREEYLTGSSVTIVLCGSETPYRKFVDWEIKATLDKEHGLIGINLPTNPTGLVPNRLFDNIQSGYAIWLHWHAVAGNRNLLVQQLEVAGQKPRSLISNWRDLRLRNG
jgi:hypothetical protein